VAWRGAAAARERVLTIASDAQTSGGLLLCVPPERVDAAMAELRAAGVPAVIIGRLGAPDPDAAATPIAIR